MYLYLSSRWPQSPPRPRHRLRCPGCCSGDRLARAAASCQGPCQLQNHVAPQGKPAQLSAERAKAASSEATGNVC